VAARGYSPLATSLDPQGVVAKCLSRVLQTADAMRASVRQRRPDPDLIAKDRQLASPWLRQQEMPQQHRWLAASLLAMSTSIFAFEIAKQFFSSHGVSQWSPTRALIRWPCAEEMLMAYLGLASNRAGVMLSSLNPNQYIFFVSRAVR
jgi:hypothetical protein